MGNLALCFALAFENSALQPWQKDWDSGMFVVCVFLPIIIFLGILDTVQWKVIF